MASIYSRRLVPTRSVTGATPVVIGTVPSGHVWVLKYLISYNGSGTNAPLLLLRIRDPAVTALTTVGFGNPVLGTVIHQLFLPMNAGDIVEAIVAGAGLLNVTLAGYDFDS